MEDYLCWYAHGEQSVRNESILERIIVSTSSTNNMHSVVNNKSNHYKNMIMKVMRMNQGNFSQYSIIEEEPNTDATRFFLIC